MESSSQGLRMERYTLTSSVMEEAVLSQDLKLQMLCRRSWICWCGVSFDDDYQIESSTDFLAW